MTRYKTEMKMWLLLLKQVHRGMNNDNRMDHRRLRLDTNVKINGHC